MLLGKSLVHLARLYHYIAEIHYAYVRNNPALRIDRYGLWDITVHAYKDRDKYGYGIAVVKDRHGKEVYSSKVRLEGVGGRNTSSVRDSVNVFYTTFMRHASQKNHTRSQGIYFITFPFLA